jgi:cysteine synthase
LPQSQISNLENPYRLEYKKLREHLNEVLNKEKYKILRAYHDDYYARKAATRAHKRLTGEDIKLQFRF